MSAETISQQDSPSTPTQQSSGWYLDKRVPLALIFAIIIQSSAMGAWGATVTQRIHNLEESVTISRDYGERLTRIETLLETMIRQESREQKQQRE